MVDEDGLIGLLHVSKLNYYKLPGGGMKKYESIEGALKREIREETGCKIEIVSEVGEIEESRPGFHQVNYCYICRVIDPKLAPSFSREESREGFQLVWLRPEEALKKMQENEPFDLIGKHKRERDLIFLSEAIGKIAHIITGR